MVQLSLTWLREFSSIECVSGLKWKYRDDDDDDIAISKGCFISRCQLNSLRIYCHMEQTTSRTIISTVQLLKRAVVYSIEHSHISSTSLFCSETRGSTDC